jgi:hypothetical protein
MFASLARPFFWGVFYLWFLVFVQKACFGKVGRFKLSIVIYRWTKSKYCVKLLG